MAQDEQAARLQRLRMARTVGGTRTEPNRGGAGPNPAYAFAPPGYLPPQPRRQGGTLLSLLMLALFAAAIVGGVAYIFHQFHSSVGGPKRTVLLTVRNGEGVGAIANDLQAKGLVSSSFLFQTYYRINGGSDHIHAGIHRLDTTMSMDALATQLQQPVAQPTPAPAVVRTAGTSGARGIANAFPVTFLCCKRAEELGALLEKTGIVPSKAFMHEVRTGHFNYWFLKSRPAGASLEGFLYPGTYLLADHDNAHRVVGLMLATFNHAFTGTMHLEAARAHRNAFQIVTMASVIAKETFNARDTPYVASVYYNRLVDYTEVAGMLDADPTVQYAMDTASPTYRWWKSNPNTIDTTIDSPYNTYKHAGLPPGPISSPGIHSLLAALRPARSRYLYFKAYSTDGGKIFHTYFCQTDACQQNNAGVRIH